jgi:hypothetical protein
MHFSPYFDPVLIVLKPFISGRLFSTPIVVLYLASLFCSFLTLMIAGVAAALHERFSGLKQSSTSSLGIWLGGKLLLSAPSFLGAAGFF